MNLDKKTNNDSYQCKTPAWILNTNIHEKVPEFEMTVQLPECYDN